MNLKLTINNKQKLNVHGRYPAQIWGSHMLPRFRSQKPATQIPLIIHPRHIGDDQMRDLTRRSHSEQHPLKDQSQRPPTSTSITPTTLPSHGRTFDHRTEGPNPLIYNTILITILFSWVRRTSPQTLDQPPHHQAILGITDGNQPIGGWENVWGRPKPTPMTVRSSVS